MPVSGLAYSCDQGYTRSFVSCIPVVPHQADKEDLHCQLVTPLSFPFISCPAFHCLSSARTDPGFTQVGCSFLQTALSTRPPKWRRNGMILRITSNKSPRKDMSARTTPRKSLRRWISIRRTKSKGSNLF